MRCLFCGPGAGPRLVLAGLTAALLAACQPEADTAPPQVRPVRTVTVVKRDVGETVSFTGRIQAENEARLGFRIPGRMIERPINVGDHVEPGQVVARLEPHDELNALRTAQAGVAAAQARLNETQNIFERQKTLLARDIASRAQFEQAEATLKTARAQLDTAEAQLKAAKDRVSFTELQADAAGTVVATGAEPGEVVQAGQMIVRVARQGGRDAVFDVPAQVLRSAPDRSADHGQPDRRSHGDGHRTRARGLPPGRPGDPDLRGQGRPDRSARGDAPGRDDRGAHAAGHGSGHRDSCYRAHRIDRRPAVWVVDPKSLTVSLRNVEVARNDPATVVVSEGLDTGEIVVTAGIQALHPGQKTRLLDSAR